jgi:hypothetical protein
MAEIYEFKRPARPVRNFDPLEIARISLHHQQHPPEDAIVIEFPEKDTEDET